uniref:hypothetical protein n=1 Tax=Tessaracoccus bendigoensis TaxID=72764 RepID=UPI001C3167A6
MPRDSKRSPSDAHDVLAAQPRGPGLTHGRTITQASCAQALGSGLTLSTIRDSFTEMTPAYGVSPIEPGIVLSGPTALGSGLALSTIRDSS